jgi:hypothetical protein
MRVFVSEFLTERPLPSRKAEFVAREPVESLVTEGVAMLAAVAADLRRIDDVEIHSILGSTAAAELWPEASRQARSRLAHVADRSKAGLERPPEIVPIVWHRLHNSDEAAPLFARLTVECDATLLIAPEISGVLAKRCRVVEHAGRRLLGPSSTAVETCADKLALCRRLHAAGVPTIDTFEFDVERPAADLPFPVVIKPRDGCGSLATYILLHRVHLAWQLPVLRRESLLRNAVWQPFIAGQALSVGVLISTETGRDAAALPVCDQILSGDGRLQYRGGRIPANCSRAAEVQQIALAACANVPGLRGYVGVDMLLPDDPRSPPLVIEVNPRLTTSYLGYQALCLDNLAEWMLFPERRATSIRWRTDRISFAPAGPLPTAFD